MMLQPIRISFMEAVRGTKRHIALAGMRGMEVNHQVEVDIPPGRHYSVRAF